MQQLFLQPGLKSGLKSGHILGNALWAGLLLLIALPAAAQLYKIVGPDGKVTYSDTPPPPSKTGKVERKNLAGGGNDVNLPYELAEAVKNHPVTLYTTSACAGCDEGRNLLRQRGVPFTEKTVSSNEDQVKLRQAGGDLQLPLLLVGRSKQRGYEPNGWQAALTAAQYPESNKLPSNYSWRAPEPAAPPPPEPKEAAKATAPEVRNPAATPPPENNAPPGFRF
jgi:glutaredoxin